MERNRSSGSSRGGFALLEVVVALAVLAVAVVGLAATLQGALRTLGVAAATGRALAAAQAAAHTSLTTSAGWVPVPPGTVPAGTVAGAAGGAARSPAPPCWQRTLRGGGSAGAWLWVEVHCGPRPLPVGGQTAPPGATGAARLAVPR